MVKQHKKSTKLQIKSISSPSRSTKTNKEGILWELKEEPQEVYQQNPNIKLTIMESYKSLNIKDQIFAWNAFKLVHRSRDNDIID
jgi:hypothetical protein